MLIDARDQPSDEIPFDIVKDPIGAIPAVNSVADVVEQVAQRRREAEECWARLRDEGIAKPQRDDRLFRASHLQLYANNGIEHDLEDAASFPVEGKANMGHL